MPTTLSARGKFEETHTWKRSKRDWVFRHIRVEGNEKADELASEEVFTFFMGSETFCGIGANTIKGF